MTACPETLEFPDECMINFVNDRNFRLLYQLAKQVGVP